MCTGFHNLKVQTHKHGPGLCKVRIKNKRKKKLLSKHNDNIINMLQSVINIKS